MPRGRGGKNQGMSSTTTSSSKSKDNAQNDGGHNITMEELLEIIEKKARQLFESEINNLKSEIQILNKNVQSLTDDRDSQKRENDKLWHEINKERRENLELKMKLDALEEKSKVNNVRIVNFPEVDGDKDVKLNITNMASDNLNIEDFEEEDVIRTWRLGRESANKTRDLIVTFTSREKRDEFYKECKKTKVKAENGNFLYINEDLTTLRSKLFYDTRRLMKTGKIHSTWTQKGNIMVKTDEDAKPRAVYNHHELKTLLYEATDAE